MANITKNLGVVAPTVKGDWEATITYNELSIVSHKGATYIAKQQTLGVEPSVSIGWENYWQLLVKSCECAVVQETGTSKTETMSQDATTKELNTKLDTTVFNEKVAEVETQFTTVNTAITTETTERNERDTALQNNIDAEVIARQEAVKVNAEAISNLYGESGSITIAVSSWESSQYKISMTALGDNDAIFLSPSTKADQTALNEAEVFTTTDKSIITFTATKTPTVNITLNYFIARGKA